MAWLADVLAEGNAGRVLELQRRRKEAMDGKHGSDGLRVAKKSRARATTAITRTYLLTEY